MASLANLVKDYKCFSKFPNVTFLGINTSMTADKKRMDEQIKQYGLHQLFANMLDAGGITARAYRISPWSLYSFVVIDPDGNMVWNNISPSMVLPQSPQLAQFTAKFDRMFEKWLKKAPGILDRSNMPSEMKQAARYYDLQLFDRVEREVAAVLKASPSSEADRFAEVLKEKMATTRKARLTQVADLALTDSLQAYREAMAFVNSFPSAPETPTLRSLCNKLINKCEVKQEILAQNAFQTQLATKVGKSSTLATHNKEFVPLLRTYLQVYGKTKYAETAKQTADGVKAMFR